MAGESNFEIICELARVRRHLNTALERLCQSNPKYLPARDELGQVLEAVPELRAMHEELLRKAATAAAAVVEPDER